MAGIYLPLIIKPSAIPSDAKRRIPRITAVIRQLVHKPGKSNRKKKNINIIKVRFSQWDQLQKYNICQTAVSVYFTLHSCQSAILSD